jgi:PAS domain S-box-containing protein
MPYTAELKSFQKLFDLSLDVICILDYYGHFIKVNKAAIKIWGYQPEELIGRKIFDLIYEPDKEKTLDITKEAIAEGKMVFNFENRYIRKDGSLVDMEWSTSHEADEGIAYCIGREISGRRQKERQIIDQKEKLEKAQEIAQLGYWEYDMLNQTGYWSDSLYTLFGLNKATYGEATLEKFFDLVHPDDRNTVRENMELFKTHDKLEHVLRIVKPNDGSTIYINNIYSILKDKEGNIQKLSGVSQDITEKVLLEKRLEIEKELLKRYLTRAVIDAQEKERTKIGRDLHDNVNQVLTTVKLYLEMSISNEFNTQELQQKSIKYVTDCINEIRSISRSLSAPTLGGIGFLDSIKELVKSITETNKLQIKLKITGFGENEESLSTDLYLGIYRILQEQIANILRHAHAKHVRIDINKEPDLVTLRIEDDGIGFDAQVKRRGIGITNMITRAEALNGQLYIESEPGKGTIVTCIFNI